MKPALAVVAGLLAIVAAIPYARDVISRRTKPNVVSWFTWTLLLIIATSATFAAGAVRTALFNLGDLIGTCVVLFLGFKYGIARMSRLDVICQAGAVVALALWFIFDSPAVAIVAAVTVDAIAFIPTFRHAWVKPYEETWQAYGITLVAAALALLSLQSYSLASLTYPIYLLLTDILLVGIILRRRLPGGSH